MTGPIRMSPEDSAFWKMESDISRMHSVTLATFAGPAPTIEELRDYLAGLVPLVPRFRQRVLEIPLDLGRPMWVDCPEFDLDDHLVTASAGSLASLSELVSLIVSERLDRTRPLWEITSVTGLPDDQWALVSKVHHSMIDGLFGTEPLAVMIDGAVGQQPPPAPWNPSPPPPRNELVTRTMTELLFNPAEQYRFVRAQSQRRRRQVERLVGRPPGQPAPDPTGLRGPVGGRRIWSSVTVPMSSVRTARERCGATTHELLLGLVTTGVRWFLLSRDESGSGWPTVNAIVPIAVAGAASNFNGGIQAEILELPTTERNLDERVRRLHEQGRSVTSNPVAIDAQVGVSGLNAPALVSLGLREATRRGVIDRKAHTVIVNVPGPRHELSVLGRPMTELYPVMPLAAGVRLSVGIVSYLDHLTFGVTGDRDSVPDVQLITSGIRSGLDELTADG